MSRLVPQYPFPRYGYVPGLFPRTSTSEGSGFEVESLPRPNIDDWLHCDLFRFGIDLFNHGYYWEAHEAWEQVWHALGRTGGEADFVKGLIKLAAAGVKAREGRAGGVTSHAQRAAELFTSAQAADSPRLAGLPLCELLECAARVADKSASIIDTSPEPTVLLFARLPELW